ncbi:MAG: Uma2 family endonuclease [Cyanobacteria bacterium P01_H01_bin.121]
MVQAESLKTSEIIYPESDRQPMADNTKQYRWIVRLAENLKRLFTDQEVFVAADLFWYPIEGQPKIVNAPDVFVALGRPDSDAPSEPLCERGSYKQWEEDNVTPQVVFEILSPGNTVEEIQKKQVFYVQHGVLETFFYNPDTLDFWGLVRSDRSEMPGHLLVLNLPWESPTLGIRFVMEADGLAMFYPNGDRFEDPQDWAQKAAMLQQAQAERDQALQERDQAWARLRELGIDPEQL